MALLFLDSCDHYQDANVLSKWTEGFFAPGIAVGQGRCGTNALDMDYRQVTKGLNFGSTRATVGCAIKVVAASSLSVASNFLYLGNSTTNHCCLQANNDGSLEVICLGTNTSIGRSVADLMHMDHWYFIEWQLLVDGAAGATIVRVNGDVVISTTGVRTAGGFDPGPIAEVILRTVEFNCGSNHRFLLDDVYVLDSTGPAPQNTFLGDCRIEYLRPRAAGAFQQWTPVGTTAHWSAVDDNATPDDDTTYIESTTPGQKDTSLYKPTGLPAGPIFGAQLSLYAKKSEIGPRTIAPVVNGVSGPPFVGVSYGTYQYYHTAYGTNPATGLPWTIAEINAIDAGVVVNS